MPPLNRSANPADRLSSDLGRLVLRWTLGALILLHGVAKIGSGPGAVMEMLRAHDLPGALAYAVYIGEVLAPVLLILGLWTRLAALLVLVNMAVAVGLAHMADLARLNGTGGWAIELQAMYGLTALAIALLGAGAIGIGGSQGRFN